MMTTAAIPSEQYSEQHSEQHREQQDIPAEELDQFVNAILCQSKSDNACSSLKVYENNFLSAKIQSLCLNYPCVTQLLGDEITAALSKVYAQHYPSQHWDLNVYGQSFHQFIAKQNLGPKAHLRPWEALGHLAQIESALVQCYYGYNRVQIEAFDLCDLFSLYGLTDQQLQQGLLQSHPYLRCDKALHFNHRLEVSLVGHQLQLINT
ncbi:MAG: hypothetical protein ACI93R_001882 [Flavobacteriales bacterium]|jgi:hypothetical protein